MKVIESGRKEFVATCPFCGCKFLYDKKDVDIDFVGKHANITVLCPECRFPTNHEDVLKNI